MLEDLALVSVLTGLQTVGLYTTFYRAMDARYFESVNSVIGSVKSEGRFHHRDDALGTLYLGLSQRVALEEMMAGRGALFPPAPHLPSSTPAVLIVPFVLRLSRLLDLRNREVQTRLSTNAQELSGSWLRMNRQGERAPTQCLARAAQRVGLEGLLYTSARMEEESNVVLFVGNLSETVRAGLPENFPEQQLQDARADPVVSRRTSN